MPWPSFETISSGTQISSITASAVLFSQLSSSSSSYYYYYLSLILKRTGMINIGRDRVKSRMEK
jgi:hypothetical protein